MPLMSTGGGGEGDTDAVSDAVGDGDTVRDDTVRDNELLFEPVDVGEAVGDAVRCSELLFDCGGDCEDAGGRCAVREGEAVGDTVDESDALHTHA